MQPKDLLQDSKVYQFIKGQEVYSHNSTAKLGIEDKKKVVQLYKVIEKWMKSLKK
jgi:hypothetical protein